MEITRFEGDFNTSLEKALGEIEPNFTALPGIIVTGSHLMNGIEEKLALIKKAREENIPFLGICAGMQLASIEWVRNFANLKEANSTEINKNTPNPVVVKMKERFTGIAPVTWFDGNVTYESHWHNYALNPYYLRYFPNELWDISFGKHCIEIMKLKIHPFFWLTQFHSEYQSSKDKPHPLLLEFINICRNN